MERSSRASPVGAPSAGGERDPARGMDRRRLEQAGALAARLGAVDLVDVDQRRVALAAARRAGRAATSSPRRISQRRICDGET